MSAPNAAHQPDTSDPPVGAAHVVIFSWVRCPYCVRAKALLMPMTKNIKVFELDQMGAQGEHIHRRIIQATGHDTVPAIYIGGVLVGGYSEVDALYKSGKLQPMIEAGSKGPLQ